MYKQEVAHITLENIAQIGKKIREKLIPGVVLSISGPLGAGKTTLIKHILPECNVASPSFLHMLTYVVSDNLQKFDANSDLENVSLENVSGPNNKLELTSMMIDDATKSELASMRLDPKTKLELACGSMRLDPKTKLELACGSMRLDPKTKLELACGSFAHIDAYTFKSREAFLALGVEELLETHCVIIEWGQLVEDIIDMLDCTVMKIEIVVENNVRFIRY